MDKINGMNPTDMMFINTLSGNMIGGALDVISQINCSSDSKYIKDKRLHNLLEFYIHLSQNCYNLARKAGLEYKEFDKEMRSLKSELHHHKRSKTTMKRLKGGVVTTLVKHVKGRQITLFDPVSTGRHLGQDAQLIAERAIIMADAGRIGDATRLYTTLVEFQGLIDRERKEGPIRYSIPVALGGVAGGLGTIPLIIIYVNVKVIVPLGIAAATAQVSANGAAGVVNYASRGIGLGTIFGTQTATAAAAGATSNLNQIAISLISVEFGASLMFCGAIIAMLIAFMIIQHINSTNAPRRLKLNNNLRTRRREIANRAATFLNDDDTQKTANLALFGLDESATDENIRRARRREALKLHPDRHASKSDSEKKALRTQFNAMEAAYKRLDPGHASANSPPNSPSASVASGPVPGAGTGLGGP
jgi:hypothetical protein